MEIRDKDFQIICRRFRDKPNVPHKHLNGEPFSLGKYTVITNGSHALYLEQDRGFEPFFSPETAKAFTPVVTREQWICKEWLKEEAEKRHKQFKESNDINCLSMKLGNVALLSIELLSNLAYYAKKLKGELYLVHEGGETDPLFFSIKSPSGNHLVLIMPMVRRSYAEI